MEYLQIEKNASPYTVTYYADDLESFSRFLHQEGIDDLQNVDYRVIRSFLTALYDRKLGRRSVSRKISSLKSFSGFWNGKQSAWQSIPSCYPSYGRKTYSWLPLYGGARKTFDVSDLSDPIGQRNQALIETLYATGIRVSECQRMQLSDIDFVIGTMFVKGKGSKERYIPFGRFCGNCT